MVILIYAQKVFQEKTGAAFGDGFRGVCVGPGGDAGDRL